MIQRVGVIGGGQLAWMMAFSAKRLGIDLIVQTPHANDPAVSVATEVILAPVADAQATSALAQKCDVITFENEFVDLEALFHLKKQGVRFAPSLEALEPLLDKYHQREFIASIGLPVPRFTALVEPTQPLDFTFPVVLKARRHGYDGQGTFIINSLDELSNTYNQLKSVPLLIEEFIPYTQELAVIAARSNTGEVVVYPVVETQQKNQVCHRVIIPAQVSLLIQSQIEDLSRHLLNELQAVGVFGIELFLTSDNKILVNEIAPRTHNSGHYTLDACNISQFEMQLRSVTDLPLGTTDLNCDGAVMVNLLGYEYADHDYAQKRHQLESIKNAHVHWYGKTESRPGRKLGHVTVLAHGNQANYSELLKIADTIESLWYS
ncbi:5-(carboxyamino)imidazole ribonucleotide synthase [Aphanothece hegewaldii CCALA 016]|uniref:N5-carboxyaminoimidazole ribonucleotide synthase n=1 Tax=Aphanothece hegewaldii CCALA 016 TaxID=2107694 RepID=A0A2T1LWY3_9CHRO|nr:5-(carboxyamino)imidazole ribonucleotide synthase [Aphanothece hegewaldii]PSF36657.1 5-(carboxyamino)imidazole ribonucleotide synthase [Aphanothece hegewaldii CCALA 016]